MSKTKFPIKRQESVLWKIPPPPFSRHLGEKYQITENMGESAKEKRL
jgi:hypothetical protein